MKKIAAIVISAFLMVTAVGCSSASKEDGGRTESTNGGAAQDVFDDSGNAEDVFGGDEIYGDGSGYDVSPEDGSGYDGDDNGYDDEDDNFDDGYDDGGDGYEEEWTDDFDYDVWLQEYTDQYSGNTNGNRYQSYKEVGRDCNGAVNTSISRFYDLFDTEFYDSDASRYLSYTMMGVMHFAGVEDIFSGDARDIERSVREEFYGEDIAWSVDGGTAVITFVAEGQDVTVTVRYDGSSTSEIIYTADGEITQIASFISNENYDIAAYSYGAGTSINAVYANGDAYCIYDYNPGSPVDFSVYQGSFDDPSELIGDRSYIAIIDGVLVY